MSQASKNFSVIFLLTNEPMMDLTIFKGITGISNQDKNEFIQNDHIRQGIRPQTLHNQQNSTANSLLKKFTNEKVTNILFQNENVH